MQENRRSAFGARRSAVRTPNAKRQTEGRESMAVPHSDAFVFFGATGDLAYKQIFPALQALIRRGQLDMPIIGVARSGWSLDQLRARARQSVEQHGGVDEAAFAQLAARLRYIDGDYTDAVTYDKLRRA